MKEMVQTYINFYKIKIIMDPLNGLQLLKESQKFTSWHNKNKETFMSFIFCSIEDGNDLRWQYGFYHINTDRITSFIVNENSIELIKEDEIFKKPNIRINALDIEKLKTTFDDILEIAKKFQIKEFSNEMISKIMVILQNNDGYGIIWNITFVTKSFKTINVKINAENGDILNHSMESLMDFVKK